ncbi:MAG: hypothetical protein AAF494_14735, partial [Pseudomonadota bacterium]
SVASAAFLFEFGGLPVIAVAFWLSFYYRDRRDGLSQGVLLAGFIINVAMSALHLALAVGASQPELVALTPQQGALVAGLCAGACFVHWTLFRFPIAFALACLATLSLGDHVLHLAFADLPAAVFVGWPIVFALCVLSLAVWWDMTDVYRETVRSDVAFWLHIFGGFMLFSSLLVALFASDVQGFSSFRPVYEFNPIDRLSAALIFALVIGLTMVALLVNRVFLALCSALFLGAAVHAMLGIENLPFTVLLIGASIVLLAAFWRELRRALLERLPLILQAQLPREQSRIDGKRPVD